MELGVVCCSDDGSIDTVGQSLDTVYGGSLLGTALEDSIRRASGTGGGDGAEAMIVDRIVGLPLSLPLASFLARVGASTQFPLVQSQRGAAPLQSFFLV